MGGGESDNDERLHLEDRDSFAIKTVELCREWNVLGKSVADAHEVDM